MRLAGDADIRRLELALLRNFRKYAHGEAPETDSLWHWLTLGQHRGLPTRMIDWTYSPFVALHFATEDTSAYDEDGIVWCVNFVEANKRLPDRLRAILDKEGSDTFTVDMLRELGTLRDFDGLGPEPFVVFVEPPAMDRRILNQFALFSLMSSPSAVLHDWMRQNPELCRSVVVPASLKWEVRDKLDQANINERVLFPDLDGLSRWLERYYTPAGHAWGSRRGVRDDSFATGRSRQGVRDEASATGRSRQSVRDEASATGRSRQGVRDEAFTTGRSRPGRPRRSR